VHNNFEVEILYNIFIQVKKKKINFKETKQDVEASLKS